MTQDFALGLYVVATPIGNLADISRRALDVLARADLVLAEDTRRTGTLYQRLGMASPRLLSLHEHNEDGRVPQVLQALEQGQVVAQVTDAGTPLVSDPGYRLVRAARRAGHTIVPVPGPSAPMAALSACGLPPTPFTFLGFLPRKAGDVKKLFAAYGGTPATLVFFERKDRVAQTLELAAGVLSQTGEREVCVARELTKEFEEFIIGPLGDQTWLPAELRGEVTVVLGPPEKGGKMSATAAVPDREAFMAILEREMQAGGKPREIARRAASAAPGWTVDQAYQALGELRRMGQAGRADGGDAPKRGHAGGSGQHSIGQGDPHDT